MAAKVGKQPINFDVTTNMQDPLGRLGQPYNITNPFLNPGCIK